MLVKKQIVATIVPVLIITMPVVAGHSTNKGGGPTVLQQQEMLLFENDIFVGRSDRQTGNAATLNRGLGLSSSFAIWTNGIVPYQFHDSMSPGGIAVVNQAIEHWNEISSITLVERDPSAADAPVDFVEFVKGPGCASWVGKQGHAQEIWVSDFCTAGSMIHEVGHALGLLHEHTRADRDQYLQVAWENIQQDKAFNFEINTSGSQDLGAYDYASIMHYGEFFFSSNGKRTMVPINAPDDVVIGQRKAASEGDLMAIDALYSTDLGLSTDLSNTSDSTEVSFLISNLTDVGAHQITLDFTIGSVQEIMVNAEDNVDCVIETPAAQCRIDILPGGSTTVVSVSFDEQLDEESLSPVLSSKTHDNNLSNNGLNSATATEIEAIRSADSMQAASLSGNSGGAMDNKGLLVLFLMLLLRLARSQALPGVLHCNRNKHAFTGFATSPRRAPGRVSSLSE